MSLEVITCEQNSAAWYAARGGIVTSSCLQLVLAERGPRGGEPKGRRKYMLRLLGEQLTGRPEESYSNEYMQRGHEMQQDAANAFSAVTDLDLTQVGFIRNSRHGFVVGCSPDYLVGDIGLVEVKTRMASEQLEVLLSNDLPPEHIAQCQGALWIAEREWIEYVSFWPGLPLFIKRVTRDEAYIARMKVCVEDFYNEMAALRLRIAA